MRTTRKTFLAVLLAAAALMLFTACGSGNGANDWWVSFPEMVNRELKSQGSDISVQIDKDLCDVAAALGDGTVKIWAEYAWDGVSAESAEITAARKALADASGFDPATQVFLQEAPYTGNAKDYADDVARQIIEAAVDGKRFAKIGYTFTQYQDTKYIFAVIS